MYRLLLLRLAPLALLLAATPTLARTDTPRLLAPGTIDPALLLPPPPAPGSAAERLDLADVRAAIAAAAPAERAQATADDRQEDPSVFDPAIAPGFSLRAHPATWSLLLLVQGEAESAVSAAKHHFARTRPWGVDGTIAPCDAAPGKKPINSYPSGHAIMGYSVGMVLAELMPAKAPRILARARDYGAERVVCGAHYPSDVEASHALAAVVVARLLALPEFRTRLDAARAELR